MSDDVADVTMTLADLAADINREHVEARRCASQSLEHAKRAGELLQQVKAALPHGGWLPWLAEHCEVAPRTAQAYMRIAAGWPTLQTKTQRVAHLPVRRALALLEAPTTTTENRSPSTNTGVTVSRKYYLGARKRKDQSNRIVENIVLEAMNLVDPSLPINLNDLDVACVQEWARELRAVARKLTTFAARLERVATPVRLVG